ncbi:MAG: hypothetical protein KJI71_05410 [Patescibacteria group bacterium]|nr:hypothetical protein [Patescibacteria group bacterium]
MAISAVRVLELNEEYGLIKNLGDRDRENPEGAGLDLRVGEVRRLLSGSFLPADDTGKKRYSPETELVGDIETDGHKRITMRPGEYYLVTTMETICSPKKRVDIGEGLPPAYLMPVVFPRSSLQRGGVALLRTKTDPGYEGVLTFGLKNLGDQDFEFELGARMFNLVFEPVYGEIKRVYDEQHQGGRVTSQGEMETQN